MLSKSLRFISVILSFQLVLFYYSHQKLCFKKSQIEKKPKFRKADLNFFFFHIKNVYFNGCNKNLYLQEKIFHFIL